MPHLRRASAGLIALATLFVSSAPLPSLAAAPTRQDALNQALAQAVNHGSVSANGEFKVTLQLKGARSSDTSGTVALTFGVVNRVQPRASDVRLALKTIAYKTALAGVPVSGSVSGDGATIESRVVDDLLYVRVDNLPASMQQGASAMGMNLSSLQGRWVVFPVGILQYASQLPLLAPIAQTVTSATVQQNAAGKSVLSIKKIEKTWTATNGDEMFRARLAINTALLSSLQFAERASIKNDKAALAAITSRYASLKKSLTGMDFVAEVDRTSGSLTRLEIGGVSSQTMKSCTTNTSGKKVCRTSGALSVHWNGGFTLQPDNGLAIAAPGMDNIVGIAGN